MELALSRSHYLLTRICPEPLCMADRTSHHCRNNISNVRQSTQSFYLFSPFYLPITYWHIEVSGFLCLSRLEQAYTTGCKQLYSKYMGSERNPDVGNNCCQRYMKLLLKSWPYSLIYLLVFSALRAYALSNRNRWLACLIVCSALPVWVSGIVRFYDFSQVFNC